MTAEEEFVYLTSYTTCIVQHSIIDRRMLAILLMVQWVSAPVYQSNGIIYQR